MEVEPAFDQSELDPDGPSDRVRAELAARAAWLDSLSPHERAELVDQPIAAVEHRYASWRRAHAATGCAGPG